MKNKNIGFVLIGASLLIAVTIIIYNIQVKSLIDELMAHAGGVCVINGVCIHERSLLPLYIGGIGFITLFILGIFLIFYKEKKVENPEQKKKIEIPENIDEEEKKIISILNEKEGSIYQSDLIKETGFSKVKITRILDKLEQRKLIDRKRRGMTNIIVLR